MVADMLTVVAALVALSMIALSVTVVDAVRASHWRVVAVERRTSWSERVGQDADGEPVEAGPLG